MNNALSSLTAPGMQSLRAGFRLFSLLPSVAMWLSMSRSINLELRPLRWVVVRGSGAAAAALRLSDVLSGLSGQPVLVVCIHTRFLTDTLDTGQTDSYKRRRQQSSSKAS